MNAGSAEIIYLSSLGLKFASILTLIIGAGRVFIGIYRSHGYLYQLSDKEELTNHWIEYLKPVVRPLKLKGYRQFLNLHLKQAGYPPEWGENEFLAFQLMIACLCFFMSFIFFVVLLGMSPVLSIMLTIIILLLQQMQLYEKSTSRVKKISSELPFYIDYLALSMLAGLGFNQALEKVVSNVGKGPLAEEFELISKGLRLGMTREKALHQFKDRIRTQQVAQFVETVIQAISQGSGVSETLKSIASALNSKRFQRAEEEAGKISVKMMIPVIVFILPALMLMLLGPIILELTQV